MKLQLQPPNTTLHEKIVAALQSASKKGAPSAVLERLPPELKEKVEKVLKRFGTLTTERASALARKVKRSIKKLHRVWIEEVLNELRHLVREVNGRCVILLDPPDGESLRGTPLQRTLLSIPGRIENLAKYEGAAFKDVRSSGKRCPLCDGVCEEVAHRYYSCSNCGIVVDRDYNACFRAAARMFPQLEEWLREHPKALAPNFFNPTYREREAHALRPLSRDIPRGGSRGPARSTRG
ncbi:MAG: zinc ribbon domain-containing protein [Thermofilum sp.]